MQKMELVSTKMRKNKSGVTVLVKTVLDNFRIMFPPFYIVIKITNFKIVTIFS